jgi:hypothetical protein
LDEERDSGVEFWVLCKKLGGDIHLSLQALGL